MAKSTRVRAAHCIRHTIGDNVPMIEKVVTRRPLGDASARKADLEYWLSRPSGERMEAVEELRRHIYGDLPTLQRVARVIQRRE